MCYTVIDLITVIVLYLRVWRLSTLISLFLEN
nr:MAG TPA: hypothetical protein [Caudoviricetes sp.]